MSIMGACGRAFGKLPSPKIVIAGYMISAAIRRRIDSEAMGALVRAGTWNHGVEAIRSEIASEVGSALFDEAWEHGKVEAWQAYADERRGVWPTRSES